MFSRRTLPVWLGLIFLSGMFLMGQESQWPCTCKDADGDGYGNPICDRCTYAELDCDDGNVDVYPDAPELCDEIDNQCPGDVGYGEVDEGCQKLVFVTSQRSHGRLGGITGADATCQAEADNAGISGTFKAWLSDSDPYTAPASRFTRANVPYARIDGAYVALNWNDLTDGTLIAPINLDLRGFPGNVEVWTNVRQDGTTRMPDPARCCDNWLEGVSSGGNCGYSGAINTEWTDVTGCSCDFTFGALYCFQQ